MSKKKQKSAAPPPDRIWTPSNMLSLLRMLLVIPFVILLSDAHQNQLYLAGIAILAYLTDLLDGWVARNFEGESRLGRIIDPLADKVFIIVAVVAMAFQEMLPPWFVVIIILRDIIIFAGGVHLKNRTGLLVQSTMLGKATVVSIGLVIMLSLFSEGGTDTPLNLLMMVSLALIVVSLYKYGERYFALMKKQGRKH
jgi:cardiolipin synthase